MSALRFFSSVVLFLSCGFVLSLLQTPRMPRRILTCNVFHCVCARWNDTTLVNLKGINTLNTNRRFSIIANARYF
jgi:hypothetical protein